MGRWLAVSQRLLTPDGGWLYAPGNESSKGDTQMARDSDELAIERYRYLLRTAPPEEIERAHAEAFAALTPEQRQKVIEGLASSAPESELAAAGDDPQRLARVATRAEMSEPGTMERVYGQMPARGGFLGGLGFGGTFLNTLAGAFVGTAIASALFGSYGYPPGDPADSRLRRRRRRRRRYRRRRRRRCRRQRAISVAGTSAAAISAGATSAEFDV